MENTSKIHLEILDNKRSGCLDLLTPHIHDYVLGGGTALALQVCHRQSFDFDFFSSKEIPKNLLEKISKIIPVKSVSIDTLDELTFITKDDIKITFLYYPFINPFPIEKTDHNLQYFSIKAIALQKAYAIGRRGAYRDYFDLYTILHSGVMDLNEIITNTKEAFGSLFDEKLFLQQLTYLGDILDFNVIPFDDKPIPTVDEVKKYLDSLTSHIINS